MAKRRNNMIRRSGSGRKSTVVLLVISIALVAIGVSFTQSGDKPELGVVNTNPVDVAAPGGNRTGVPLNPGVDSETTDFHVFLDGWSMRILSNREVRLTLPDQRFAKLQFSPMDATGIKKLRETSSSIVASTLSRLVDGDQRLLCDADSCQAGDREINTDVLFDLSDVPTFGEMYDGWGVEYGLYEAIVTVPADTDQFEIKAEGYRPMRGVNSLSSKESSFPGWAAGHYLIGAAWGTLFQIDVRWTESSKNAGDATRSSRRGFVEGDGGEIYVGDKLLLGPSDISEKAVSSAAGLNATQLTYLSSPTTGCGSSVVCTPEVVKVKREGLRIEEARICDETGSGVLHIRNSTMTIELPHPTHLAGVWGKKGSEFSGSENASSVLGYTGRPPLVKGVVKVFVSSTEIADANGLVALGGYRGEVRGDEFKLSQLGELYGGVLRNCA
jgi:hypothetical protein